MSSAHQSLDAAATERKARLAKLASLKRKRPVDGAAASEDVEHHATADDEQPSQTDKYISGRNYDTTAKGPKLGFESQPSHDQETVEQEAIRLAAATAEQAAIDEVEAQKGLDLFKIQPKKPNWDLKRDLAERVKVLDTRTQNAIATLVRERISKAKLEAHQKPNQSGDELGVEGSTLVEAVHLREKEFEEDRRRDALEDNDIVP